MGRSLDNALLNLGLRDKYKQSADTLGFNLEDLIDNERDAGLGNGGLGRLAACYLDSSATTELPVWGYGLRYKYGIFQQLISPDGSQLEAPDPWLNPGLFPWEIPRLDVTVDVRFYGQAERIENGKAVWVWVHLHPSCRYSELCFIVWRPGSRCCSARCPCSWICHQNDKFY